MTLVKKAWMNALFHMPFNNRKLELKRLIYEKHGKFYKKLSL